MKTADWIAVLFSLLGALAGSMVYAYSTFENKESATMRVATLDAKLDAILERLRMLETKLDSRCTGM